MPLTLADAPPLPLGPSLSLEGQSIGGLRLLDGQEQQLKHAKRGFLESAALAVPGTLLAAADTFMEWFGIIGKQDMEQYLQKNMPTLGSFFVEHRQGLGMAGDLLGAVVPGMIAMKAVRQGSWLAQGATKLLGPSATKFFSTGAPSVKLFEEAFQKVRNVAQKTGVANADLIPGFTESLS